MPSAALTLAREQIAQALEAARVELGNRTATLTAARVAAAPLETPAADAAIASGLVTALEAAHRKAARIR